MPTLAVLFLFLALLTACRVHVASTTQSEQMIFPEALRVSGHRLVTSSGASIRPKGVSFHDLSMFPVTNSMIDFAKKHGASIVRIPFYVGEGKPRISYDQYREKVDKIAQYAIKQGLYVILDFHPISDPKKSELLAMAQRFFSDMVAAYGQSNQVLYEIFNEPTDVPWGDIKVYAQSVIALIRQVEKIHKIDPPAVIIVGTPKWSTLVSAAAEDPLMDLNLMYTFHFYAKQQQYAADLELIADKIPIFVTEWSPFHPFDINDPTIDKRNLFKILDWMDRKQIPWTCWSFSDEQGMYRLFRTGSLNGQANEQKLEPWGRFAFKRMVAENYLKDFGRGEENGAMVPTYQTMIKENAIVLSRDIDDFAHELNAKLSPSDHPNTSNSVNVDNSSPKSNSVKPIDCKRYNRDGLTCTDVGVSDGAKKCRWKQNWRCKDGCAESIGHCNP